MTHDWRHVFRHGNIPILAELRVIINIRYANSAQETYKVSMVCLSFR